MSHLWAGTLDLEGFDALGLLAGVLVPPILIGVGSFLLVRRYRSVVPGWKFAGAVLLMWVTVLALWLFVVDVVLPWVRTTL